MAKLDKLQWQIIIDRPKIAKRFGKLRDEWYFHSLNQNIHKDHFMRQIFLAEIRDNK